MESNTALELGLKLRLVTQPPAEIDAYDAFPAPLIIHFDQYGFWRPKWRDEWLRFEVEFIPAWPFSPPDGKSWPYDDSNDIAVQHVSYTEVHAGKNMVGFKGLFAAVPGTYQLRVSVYIETPYKVRKRRRGYLISHPIHVRTYQESVDVTQLR